MTGAVIEFGPGEVCEVLAHMDLGTRDWRAKAQLLAVLGRDPDGATVSYRDLAARLGMGQSRLGRLLGEMVAARMLLVDQLGGGSRATTYRINPELRRWVTYRGRDIEGRDDSVGVRWLCEVESVLWWTFHVEHPGSAAPGRRSQNPPNRERHESPALPKTGLRSALNGDVPQKQFSSLGSSDLDASASGAEPEAEVGSHLTSQECATLRTAVLSSAVPVRGKRVLPKGSELDHRVLALADEFGFTATLGAVQAAAGQGLGVPSLVDWIEDHMHADHDAIAAWVATLPEPELTPEPAAGAADPPRPQLRPVAEVIAADVPADFARSAEQARQIRSQRSAPPPAKLDPQEVATP